MSFEAMFRRLASKAVAKAKDQDNVRRFMDRFDPEYDEPAVKVLHKRTAQRGRPLHSKLGLKVRKHGGQMSSYRGLS